MQQILLLSVSDVVRHAELIGIFATAFMLNLHVKSHLVFDVRLSSNDKSLLILGVIVPVWHARTLK